MSGVGDFVNTIFPGVGSAFDGVMGMGDSSRGMDDVIKQQTAEYVAASNAASDKADALGHEYLTENKRQFDINAGITQQVVDKQLGIMDQTAAQGKDYYDYMVAQQRPVESALNAIALQDNTERDAAETKSIVDAQEGLASKYTGLSQQAMDYGATLRASLNGEAAANASELKGEAAANARELMSTASGAAGSITSNSAKWEGDIGKDIGLYTSGNDAFRAKYGVDIQNDVDAAVADTRAGQAQSTNQAIRQALRYGIALPETVAGKSIADAQSVASAANTTRNAMTDKYRAIVGEGINAKQKVYGESNQANISAGNIIGNAATVAANNKANAATTAAGMKTQSSLAGAQAAADFANKSYALDATGAETTAKIPGMTRDLRIQDDATSLAQKLDVAGLYRGLPGASAGAYSVSTNAGNSANSNQLATTGTYMSGINQGNNTIMNGQQMALGGLGTALNSSTSRANALDMADATETAGKYQMVGSIIGTGAGVAMASDRRLKRNIVKLATRPDGIGIYEFDYIWGGGRQVGVMAQEVAKVIPEAVTTMANGFLAVYYSKL